MPLITLQQKLVMLHDFLSSGYYCDMSIVRVRSDIETLRDTLLDYISWGNTNIVGPSADLIAVINCGQFIIAECEELLANDKYSDLIVLGGLLADLKAATLLIKAD